MKQIKMMVMCATTVALMNGCSSKNQALNGTDDIFSGIGTAIKYGAKGVGELGIHLSQATGAVTKGTIRAMYQPEEARYVGEEAYVYKDGQRELIRNRQVTQIQEPSMFVEEQVIQKPIRQRVVVQAPRVEKKYVYEYPKELEREVIQPMEQHFVEEQPKIITDYPGLENNEKVKNDLDKVVWKKFKRDCERAGMTMFKNDCVSATALK